MKDWSAEFRTVEEAQEAALASLDREHQKLTEVTNMIDQESRRRQCSGTRIPPIWLMTPVVSSRTLASHQLPPMEDTFKA